MDTQFAFVSKEDIWRIHEEMKHVYAVQGEHADRLLRLERRQEDDARMKSVWSTSSPFPSVLSGTPQQGAFARSAESVLSSHSKLVGPIHHPPMAGLPNLDQGHQLNLLGNLQLDQEDEPKRGASRANSVRFDESAIQGHWTQGSRSSGDLFLLRNGSGLGGHPMVERSSSHKSDGRQSSTGQSTHSAYSAHSGRTNSLALDTSFLLRRQESDSPLESGGPSPGMALLGPVPSIIRCWLDTNFSHETLIYAAVCTGSYESYLSQRLVRQLGLEDRVQRNENESDKNRIKLPVYLPEAVVKQPSSRSSSPAPQLPALKVEFTVVPQHLPSGQKQIEVFIGSDALRAYSADILFSSNNMTLIGDNHEKFSVPLVRPEEQSLFKSLYTGVMCLGDELQNAVDQEKPSESGLHNGREDDVDVQLMVESSRKILPSVRRNGGNSKQGRNDPSLSPASPHSQLPISNDQLQGESRKSDSLENTSESPVNPAGVPFMKDATPTTTGDDGEKVKHTMNERKGQGGNGKGDSEDAVSAEIPPVRPSPSGGVWGSWRREQGHKHGDAPNGHPITGVGYQRAGRPRGTKVLRPSKSSISSSSPRSFTSQPPVGFDNGVSSRSKDQGNKNSGGMDSPQPKESRKSISYDSKTAASTGGTRETRATSTASQPRSANPIGGASAFSWLNGGQ